MGKVEIEIDDDTPLRLAEAAQLAFPDGGVTAATLRKEGKRGRLVIYRIAGKDFTTLGHIKGMRELCRVSESRPGSISSANNETQVVKLPMLPPGLSLIAVARSELDAALSTASARSKR
jgi:hypothetical protein